MTLLISHDSRLAEKRQKLDLKTIEFNLDLYVYMYI